MLRCAAKLEDWVAGSMRSAKCSSTGADGLSSIKLYAHVPWPVTTFLAPISQLFMPQFSPNMYCMRNVCDGLRCNFAQSTQGIGTMNARTLNKSRCQGSNNGMPKVTTLTITICKRSCGFRRFCHGPNNCNGTVWNEGPNKGTT